MLLLVDGGEALYSLKRTLFHVRFDTLRGMHVLRQISALLWSSRYDATSHMLNHQSPQLTLGAVIKWGCHSHLAEGLPREAGRLGGSGAET